MLSSPRKFRRASLLEYASETGSCRCRWTFGGKEGGKEREKKGDRGEKGGGLSHQGRNTRTRWYGKPIIIVFTRQQRAAIKNCLFIQARLFSIRSHTSNSLVRTCAFARVYVRARTTRRDFSAYQTVVSNFPPVRRFPACAEPGHPKKIASHFRHCGGGIKKRRYRGESSARSIARIQRHVRVAILPGNR